ALAAIAAAAGEVVGLTRTRRIFATGGETAFALCRALGISALTYSSELEPGLSLSRATIKAGDIQFAIKPGGFGDDYTWERAWRALQRGV
ncbi:MAG TPA: nucleotide-binding domain containing protein, partial [Opitutaceae bacterium]|nr:nucleotide-binding domain containing protein [Opitutaceae bacterium]